MRTWARAVSLPGRSRAGRAVRRGLKHPGTTSFVQPLAGALQRARRARIKDQVENKLHALVCSGTISLATAQRLSPPTGRSPIRPASAQPLPQVTRPHPSPNPHRHRHRLLLVARRRWATTVPIPTQPTTRVRAHATAASRCSTSSVQPASSSGLGWIDDPPGQARRILRLNRRIRPMHSGCRAAAREVPGLTSRGRPGRSLGDRMHLAGIKSRRLRGGWGTWAPAVFLPRSTGSFCHGQRFWWPLECGCRRSHVNRLRRVRSNGPRRICDVQGLSPREYQRQPHSRQLVKLMVCASAVRIECTRGPPGEHGRTRRPALSPCCREIERASGLGTQLLGWPQSVELLMPVCVPSAPPAMLLPGPK